MRRLLVLLLLLPLFAEATSGLDKPSGGGSITSGTTPITGGTASGVCSNEGGTLTCDNACTINVSTDTLTCSNGSVGQLSLSKGLTSNTTVGADVVVNGTFTGNATGWTLASGWAYNGNAVDHSSNGTGTLTPSTPLVLVAGTPYTLKFTISGWTVGTCTASAGGVSLVAVSADGTYTFNLVATATTTLSFLPSNTGRFTIDSISLTPLSGVMGTNGNAGAAIGNSSTLPVVFSNLILGPLTGVQIGISSGTWNFGTGGTFAPHPTGTNRVLGPSIIYLVDHTTTGSKALAASEAWEFWVGNDADGQTFTLPDNPGTTGLTYTVCVDTTQSSNSTAIAPNTGEHLLYDGTDATTSCTAVEIGACMSVISTTTGSGAKWVATAVTGTWTCS